MLLFREVNTDSDGLVYRPKPDTSTLKVRDRVYLNGSEGSNSVPVVAVNGDTITIEWEYPDGRLQREVVPRVCLRKVPSLWKRIWDAVS